MKQLKEYIVERGLFTKSNYRDMIVDHPNEIIVNIGRRQVEFKTEPEMDGNKILYLDKQQVLDNYDRGVRSGWRLPNIAEMRILTSNYKIIDDRIIWDNGLNLPASDGKNKRGRPLGRGKACFWCFDEIYSKVCVWEWDSMCGGVLFPDVTNRYPVLLCRNV